MKLSNVGHLLHGAMRNQWRRGSTWRIGLCEIDGDTNRLKVLTRPPVVSPESLPFETTLTADPFLFSWSGSWYLFYETFPPSGRGEISVSRSADLSIWEHLGPVLTSDHHVSYPSLTVVDGRPRLVVESSEVEEVRYHEPLDFPTRWGDPVTMLKGARFADPTIVSYDQRWWLFAETSGGRHDELSLYTTDDDAWADWRPHRANPVCVDARWARPAGPLWRREDGTLVRFGQDNADASNGAGVYGRRVAALEVDHLDLGAYSERFLGWVAFDARPSWAEERSHHVCVTALGDGRSVAAVDGRGYQTIPAALTAWYRSSQERSNR